MHVLRGLRQALVMIALAVAVAAVVAVVWYAAQGGSLTPKLGLALLVLAGLIGVTSGTELSRGMTLEARAFLGAGPDRERPDAGPGLTAIGVLLLVSAPLFVAGGLLLDRS